MSNFFKILAVLCAATISLGTRAALPTQSNIQYFRSNLGVAPAAASPLPDRFDSPRSLLWRTPIDSGQSTPIIAGGKIFLTTYREESKELATLALDQKSGEVLWKRPVPVTRIETFHAQTGNAAVATPACDGQRLYVFFGSYGLICYDLAGNKIWEHRMGPFQDEYGAGSSPILVDGNVILNQDHDTDSFLIAIDRSTGQQIWKTARPDAVRSYSTPSVRTRNGQTELLVAGALELASYHPATGEKLWWTHGLARIVIPVPVPSNDMIFMASWAPGGDAGKRIALDPWDSAVAKWDTNKDGHLAKAEVSNRDVLDRFFRIDLDQNGSLDGKEWNRHAEVFRRAQNAVVALQPSRGGELSERDVVWRYQRGAPYVATPLLDQGILWMVKDGGIVTKLDAASGRLLQEERLPGLGSYYASPVTGDGKVYFASEPGMVSVLANDKPWKVISSHDFREKIYATPVIDGNSLYIRTGKALYAFRALTE